MQKNIRQLAAIMFTDMVGYTALMQEDEDQAKHNRDRQKIVLEKLIPDYHGLVLQYYGDGTLSVFGSAIEAVECAVEIQKELQQEPKVPIRIGLHVGDIVYADDGIYGDAVNIASRIESLSVPGGILISGKLYDEIKNHPDLPAKYLGEFELKNVKRPCHVFALQKEGLTVPVAEDLKARAKVNINSIAVLPFVNMSNDPENEYFSDGITEEIINALTKVEDLHVTSRTSSFMFKGKTDDIRQIATKLNVGTILEGSVRKAGNTVRVTAQLINAVDGYHLWSEVYDRKLEDIFAVQDEISTVIANKLKTKLAGIEFEKSILKSPTLNIEAYNFYLRGLYYWNKFSADCARKAIEFYQKAIEIEPDFALAHASISGCYVFLSAIGYMSAKNAYSNAKEHALKSIELDDSLSESHLSMAMIKFFLDWDWEGAESCFLKSIELNPGASLAHHDYSLFLSAIGKYEKNVKIAEKAVSLDPLSLVNNNSLGNAYFYAERHNDAIEQFNKTLELDPNFVISLQSLGWVYLDLGKTDKAIYYFKKAQKQPGHAAKRIASLGYAYSVSGKIEESRKYLDRLKKRAKIEKNIDLNLDLAILYIGLKDYDNAFTHLENAFKNHCSELVFLNLPLWKEIFNDSRYKDLIKRIGLKK
jgi:TolB-like protein/Tfp pilus assembly protein PilF